MLMHNQPSGPLSASTQTQHPLKHQVQHPQQRLQKSSITAATQTKTLPPKLVSQSMNNRSAAPQSGPLCPCVYVALSISW